MAHEKRIEIRWRDLDALGHVNNAVYATYVDELLGEWLEPRLGDAWATVRLELDFRRELGRDQRVVVCRCELERAGTSSVTARATLTREDGDLAAEARIVLVAFDLESRRARPLTDAERSALAE